MTKTTDEIINYHLAEVKRLRAELEKSKETFNMHLAIYQQLYGDNIDLCNKWDDAKSEINNNSTKRDKHIQYREVNRETQANPWQGTGSEDKVPSLGEMD